MIFATRKSAWPCSLGSQGERGGGKGMAGVAEKTEERRGRRGGRPRLDEAARRSRLVAIRLTAAEWAGLAAQAAEAGVTPAALARRLVLERRPRVVRVDPLAAQQAAQLARLGHLLGVAARRLLVDPADRAAAEEVRAAVRRLRAALSGEAAV